MRIVFLILLLSTQAFASPSLVGTYQTHCEFESFGEDGANAGRSTWVFFENGTFKFERQYYKDTQCTIEGSSPGNYSLEGTYAIGSEVPKVTFPRGIAYRIQLKHSGTVVEDFCFHLDPKALLDAAGLYFGS